MTLGIRWASILVLFLALPPTVLRAGSAPLDQQYAQLKATLAADPSDAESWIRLADVQRVMGHGGESRESLAKASGILNTLPGDRRKDLAGSYYTTKAWLEYDATNWREAADLASEAIRFRPDRESRLVQALAIAALPNHETPLLKATAYLRPVTEAGPENRIRNSYWIWLMRKHHLFGDFDRYEGNSAFFYADLGTKLVSAGTWGELPYRRDYGYVFESNGHWNLAAKFYEMSVSRSDLGIEHWAQRHERTTPAQPASETPMPFWMNAEGGYVTGSLMAYTDHACEQMLQAPDLDGFTRWAAHVADGASRCLAIYIDQPWPWLWRTLALQAMGEMQSAARDLAQAQEAFAEVGRSDPLLDYGRGHEMLLESRFDQAIVLLEGAVAGGVECAPGWADLGMARIMTGDRPGARAAFDRALAMSPDWVVALHNRGMLCLQEQEFAAALADLERAAALAPHDRQVAKDLQRAAQLAR